MESESESSKAEYLDSFNQFIAAYYKPSTTVNQSYASSLILIWLIGLCT